MIISRRNLLALAGIVIFAASPAMAEPPIISATEAYEDLRAGRLVILDIRRPREWAKTGVAKGAWPVSMHHDDFMERLQTILDVYPNDQVALMCATGGRSGHVTSVLERAGLLGIKNLSESMLGNRLGPGWIKRGLPIVSVDVAMSDYEAKMKARRGN